MNNILFYAQNVERKNAISQMPVKTLGSGFGTLTYGGIKYTIVVCGMNSSGITNAVFKYNHSTNLWSQMQNFPGTASVTPFSFVINDIFYFGGGNTVAYFNKTTYTKQFYRYNIGSDSWTRLADFPYEVESATGIKTGTTTAHVLGGLYIDSSGCFHSKDYFVYYNVGGNTWTIYNTLFYNTSEPYKKRSSIISFLYGDYLYAGHGISQDEPDYASREVYTNYRTLYYSHSWVATTNIGYRPPSHENEIIAIGSKFYYIDYAGNVIEVDPSTNTYTFKTKINNYYRALAIAFNCNDKLVVGLGCANIGSNFYIYDDFFVYDPILNQLS